MTVLAKLNEHPDLIRYQKLHHVGQLIYLNGDGVETVNKRYLKDRATKCLIDAQETHEAVMDGYQDAALGKEFNHSDSLAHEHLEIYFNAIAQRIILV